MAPASRSCEARGSAPGGAWFADARAGSRPLLRLKERNAGEPVLDGARTARAS